LATTESGTTVRVQPTNTLEFNGADFTVAQSGSKATISIDSTGAGAALTDTQVGFGDSSNLLTGSTKFTYNDTAGSEQLKLTGTGVTDCGILLENTNTGSTSAPDLVLFRSATGADNDFIGRMDYRGKNASGSDVTYVMVSGKINDASEDAGRIGWFVSGNASLNADDAQLMIFGRTALSGNPGLVSINNSARSDVDFRVSGDTNANLIRTDASLDGVGIGIAPPSGHAGVTVRLTVKGDDDDIALMLQNEGADAEDGPEMVFYRNSSSPAADDLLGRIRFDGEDSGDNVHTYFRMTNAIKDPTDASEDGRFLFESRAGGFLIETMRFEGDDVIFNNSATNSVDVKILGDNDTILFSDASQDNLGLGTASPSSGVERLHVVGSGSSTLVKMESTDAGATDAPDIVLYRNTASPAADDVIGSLQWSTNASDGTEYTAAKIESKVVDTTAGSENAKLQFYGGDQGGNQLVFEINGAADLVVNPDSNSFRDFSVKTANKTSIFSDSSADNVGIGTGSPNSNALLHITDDGTKANTVRIESTDNDTAVGPVLDLRRNNADGTATDGDNLGVIQFAGLDDGGGSEVYARIRATAADTHSTLAEGAIEFLAAYNNVETEAMRIGPINDGGSANFGVDVNYNSQSTVDFRVRGDSVANMLYCDVSSDKIGIHTFPRSGGSELQVNGAAEFLSFFNTKGAAAVTLSNEEGFNSFITLTYDAGAQAITLPTAVNGMKITLARQQATNAPTVVAATGEKINGVSAPSTITMGAQYSVVVLHGITGTGWIAYEPAVAA
jgi:hypothetical protein